MSALQVLTNRLLAAVLAMLMVVGTATAPEPDPEASLVLQAAPSATPLPIQDVDDPTVEPPMDPPGPTATPVPATWLLSGQMVVGGCMRFVSSIRGWADDEELAYLATQPDLILAIAAKETHCNPGEGIDNPMNGVGLMAVVPKPWTSSIDVLLQPRASVYWGMVVLNWNITDPENNPEQDLRRALAAYNCGWRIDEPGRCQPPFGYAYADDILEFWRPLVVAALNDFMCRDFEMPGRRDDQDWLRSLGYGCEGTSIVLE